MTTTLGLATKPQPKKSAKLKVSQKVSALKNRAFSKGKPTQTIKPVDDRAAEAQAILAKMQAKGEDGDCPFC